MMLTRRWCPEREIDDPPVALIEEVARSTTVRSRPE
jgi:hypothetical protein